MENNINKYDTKDLSKLFIESEKADKSEGSSRRSSSSSTSPLPLPPRRASSVLGSPYPTTPLDAALLQLHQVSSTSSDAALHQHQVTSTSADPAGKHQQQRSHSLVNLPAVRPPSSTQEAAAAQVKLSKLWEYADRIDEDCRGDGLRRASLQYDKVDGMGSRRMSRQISVQPSTATLSTSSSAVDPFGPQLSGEQLATLPGTPLPALLPGTLEYTELGYSHEEFDDKDLVDGEFGAGDVPTPPGKDEVDGMGSRRMSRQISELGYSHEEFDDADLVDGEFGDGDVPTPPGKDEVDGMGSRRMSRQISVQPSTATLSTSSSAVDPFGPQLSGEQLATLPGTPLPALLPGTLEYTELGYSHEEFDDKDLVDGEFGDGDVPTPPGKDELLEADTLYFQDGKRKIDMVLVYEEEDLGVMTEAEARRRDNRKTFQENLRKEGLELEVEHKDRSFDGRTWFLKIHIPWKLKTRYAAVMNLKFPVKRFIPISVKAWEQMQSNVSRSHSTCSTCMFEPRGTRPVRLAASRIRGDENKEEKNKNFITKWRQYFKDIFEFNHNLIDEEPSFYMATQGDREEQFIVKDRITSYSSAQRSLIVMQILLRVKYEEADKVGIRRLLNDGTYTACFPLHEGYYEQDEPDGSMLDRRLLYLEWARPAKWYKKQPLNLVRKYFGDKIGLYFCWLGFYTKMLYAPAIVGTLCFFYGLLSMGSEYNVPSKEICDPNGPGNITMCPLCDKACQYQDLKESCLFARLTYLFDNPATVFFAIFMSIWATVFLELWKRKETVIQWEWDLSNVERDEEARPEFETSVKTFRTNPVTREKEPYLPTWSRALRFFATGSAVFFMILVVLGAVLGTIIYRISIVSVIYGGGGIFLKTHAKIFTTMTAALINLVIIMTLTRLYHKLAIWLTNMENPRTQTEYEDSYTFKIFLFEFMNFYSSLIYIAFFKGRFFDYPGDTISRQSEFLRVKGDVCDPAGCLSELCIQLAIIMIGKQCFNNIMEILNPKFYNWLRQRNHRHATKDLTRTHTRWEEDYHLQDPGRLALFDEYLEMILQYGFVTLFVAAFPLAPLCALLNNIVEIRLDAYKMVTQARRPLAERVEDIGAWFGILRVITYAAVVSNAFVIAYTSDFIPRMVYKYKYSEDGNLVGYINASLSVFNTSHYTEDMGSDVDDPDPPFCRYRGYRNPPEGDDQYDLSPQYWHVFAARLAFVVIFEHIVFSIVGIMQYAIPDVPSELQTQIQRENLLAKEAKYEHGLRRNSEFEISDVVHTLRENNNASRSERSQGLRGSWARRLSKISDGLDAHVEVTGRKRNPTVWEVT